MNDDKAEALGPALAEVGQEAMRILGGKPDGVYLYVEIGDGWVGPSLFRNEGEVVTYYDTSGSKLWRLLIDA